MFHQLVHDHRLFIGLVLNYSLTLQCPAYLFRILLNSRILSLYHSYKLIIHFRKSDFLDFRKRDCKDRILSRQVRIILIWIWERRINIKSLSGRMSYNSIFESINISARS